MNLLQSGGIVISISKLMTGFEDLGYGFVLNAKLSSMYKYRITEGSPSKLYAALILAVRTFSSLCGSM